VALLILTLLAVALGGTFLVGYKTLTREARQIAGDTAVSSASLTLLRDLSSSSITSPLPDTISPGAGTLTLTDGPTSGAATVTYTIDANNNLIRTLSGASTGSFTAARGIQLVTVSSGTPACRLSVSLTPSAVGASTQTLTVDQRVGTAGCF